jgi:hypothetical protein
MPRIRLSAAPGPSDHKLLSTLREDLYAYSGLNIDPDNPAYAIHRDDAGRAYFDVTAAHLQQVTDAIASLDERGDVEATVVEGPAGDPCLRCGYIAGEQPPATCPNCGFVDTSPCPHCDQAVSRLAYLEHAGDVLECPNCHGHVRLRFNDPLLTEDGDYSQPVVVVESAGEAR